MAIYLGSRYENALVDFIAFSNPLDAAPLVVYNFPPLGRLTYSDYTWTEGDRLDQVAVKFYKYPEKWWLIAVYNPEIEDHQNIPAGTVLRIPHV